MDPTPETTLTDYQLLRLYLALTCPVFRHPSCLAHFHREQPPAPAIIVSDGLASRSPFRSLFWQKGEYSGLMGGWLTQVTKALRLLRNGSDVLSHVSADVRQHMTGLKRLLRLCDEQKAL